MEVLCIVLFAVLKEQRVRAGAFVNVDRGERDIGGILNAAFIQNRCVNEQIHRVSVGRKRRNRHERRGSHGEGQKLLHGNKSFQVRNSVKPGQRVADLPGHLERVVARTTDRKSVGEGKSVSVRVDLGGRRIIKKKKKEYKQ